MELEKFLVGQETNAFQSIKFVIASMIVQTGVMRSYMNVLRSLIKFPPLNIPHFLPTLIRKRIRVPILIGTKWTITLQALITILITLEILIPIYLLNRTITIRAVNFNRHSVSKKNSLFFSHLILLFLP